MKTEPIESRIAPATVLTFVEGDGDILKISASKCDNAPLDATASTPISAADAFASITLHIA